ncbi:hypothetical protein PUN28_008519 [Cardiocondyla obscurior]|uniref:Uncharacterized protein n=1 Tax=Cardiocondyla obscurior TaxID=286306 RepID=A0AAW2G0Y3_9HYME
MRVQRFHARVWKKKRPGARGLVAGAGREDVDIFLRATRECRERHAFDWPGVGRGGGGGRARDEDERRGRLGGRARRRLRRVARNRRDGQLPADERARSYALRVTLHRAVLSPAA